MKLKGTWIPLIFLLFAVTTNCDYITEKFDEVNSKIEALQDQSDKVSDLHNAITNINVNLATVIQRVWKIEGGMEEANHSTFESVSLS